MEGPIASSSYPEGTPPRHSPSVEVYMVISMVVLASKKTIMVDVVEVTSNRLQNVIGSSLDFYMTFFLVPHSFALKRLGRNCSSLHANAEHPPPPPAPNVKYAP